MLMMYRHGLRVSEAIGLRRDDVDLDQARLWVRRLKNGLAVEQPIAGDELRAIKRYLATRIGPAPLALRLRTRPAADPAVRQLPDRGRGDACRVAAGPSAHAAALLRLRPGEPGHDLRLIQDYLGHRDPRHTVHYTRVAGRRFEGLWK